MPYQRTQVQWQSPQLLRSMRHAREQLRLLRVQHSYDLKQGRGREKTASMPEPIKPEETVRLDRWLWAARFYKSRSLAAEACDGGKVEVNGHPAKPHKLVRVRDEIVFTHPSGPKELTVLGLSEQRGP